MLLVSPCVGFAHRPELERPRLKLAAQSGNAEAPVEVFSYVPRAEAHLFFIPVSLVRCQESKLISISWNDRYRLHLNFNAMDGCALSHVGHFSGIKDVDIGMAML